MLQCLMKHYCHVALVVLALSILYYFNILLLNVCTILLLHYINAALAHIAVLMLHYLNVALFTVVPFNVVLY